MEEGHAQEGIGGKSQVGLSLILSLHVRESKALQMQDYSQRRLIEEVLIQAERAEFCGIPHDINCRNYSKIKPISSTYSWIFSMKFTIAPAVTTIVHVQKNIRRISNALASSKRYTQTPQFFCVAHDLPSIRR